MLIVAGLAGLLSGAIPHGYGWAGLTIAALVSLGYMGTFYYSKVEDLRRFWLVIGVLALIHIPVIAGLRPYAEQYRFMFLLLFASIDCLVIAWSFQTFCV